MHVGARGPGHVQCTRAAARLVEELVVGLAWDGVVAGRVRRVGVFAGGGAGGCGLGGEFGCVVSG